MGRDFSTALLYIKIFLYKPEAMDILSMLAIPRKEAQNSEYWFTDNLV